MILEVGIGNRVIHQIMIMSDLVQVLAKFLPKTDDTPKIAPKTRIHGSELESPTAGKCQYFTQPDLHKTTGV